MSAQCRAEAATVLAAVMSGATLEEPLRPALERVSQDERALLQQLCYGTLRGFDLYQGLLRQLLDKDLKRKDTDIKALILCGMHQLLDMRTPDHAVISLTVDACRSLKKHWATRLVNGVLRRFLRESNNLHAALTDAERARHPQWLYEHLGQQWPAQFSDIVTANNEHPPMCLRVNTRLGSRENYMGLLAAAGIGAETCVLAKDGIRLEKPMDVSALPGFADGLASVQDEAAQLSADLLSLEPGQSVLDACSAPGGKTCHLLERQPQLAELVAMDISEQRLQRVAENLERLQLEARLQAGDAGTAGELFANASFDAILVDAPCSGSGVIRRHPDIKLLRRQSDIAGFAESQLDILQGLWPLLRPGGQLLYVTCSILPAENDQLIDRFLAAESTALADDLDVAWGLALGHGRQLLQSPAGSDGLFFCRLVKQD